VKTGDGGGWEKKHKFGGGIRGAHVLEGKNAGVC